MKPDARRPIYQTMVSTTPSYQSAATFTPFANQTNDMSHAASAAPCARMDRADEPAKCIRERLPKELGDTVWLDWDDVRRFIILINGNSGHPDTKVLAATPSNMASKGTLRAGTDSRPCCLANWHQGPGLRLDDSSQHRRYRCTKIRTAEPR
jgi:hypothetical protein